MKRSEILLCLLLHIAFYATPSTTLAQQPKNENKIVIAFGSCSDEDKEQILWDDIIAENADLWIWLGDNIYGDSDDMRVLRQKYDKQKSHPQYQQLREQTTIIGTWDDHDYGLNDGGKHFKMKRESQQVFLDFLDVPADEARRNQEGVYGRYDLNHPLAKVSIFLLDARYFRDDLMKKGDRYVENRTGEVLGEEQWRWLTHELENSNADVHIFASGIQIIPEQHRFEKWSNFPLERTRLFELIFQTEVKNPIFITGDRHIGEISRITYEDEIFYEITSSSLTHGWSKKRLEANRHRLGKIVYDENYGILEITKNGSLTIEGKLILDQGKVKEKVVLKY